MDLVVLTPGSASAYKQALGVYAEDDPGDSDEERIGAFVRDLDRAFDEPVPFDRPIVRPAYVLLTVAWESWEETVSAIVDRAHRHGLVVLDPQEERLFPPGTPYELTSAEKTDGLAELTVTMHHADGRTEEFGVFSVIPQRWRWDPRRLGRRARGCVSCPRLNLPIGSAARQVEQQIEGLVGRLARHEMNLGR